MNRVAIVFLTFLFVNSCSAQEYDLDAPIPIDPKIKTGILENGIKYFIIPNTIQKGKAFFYSFFSIGSLQETKDQFGIAHILEHVLCYSDSLSQKGKYFKHFQSLGLKWGRDINAHSSIDNTNYSLLNVPLLSDGTIDTALLLLKEWPDKLIIDTTFIAKELKIVDEELGLRSNIINEDSILKMLKNGSSNTINPDINTDISNLLYFHNQWYHPNFESLIVIGDFDPNEVEKKVKNLFSSINFRPGFVKSKLRELPVLSLPKVTISKIQNISLASIEFHFKHKIPNTNNLSYLRRNIAQKVIENMYRIRLQQISDSINKKPIIPSFYFSKDFLGFNDYESCVITVQSDVEKIKEMISSILAENERLIKFGFTDEELANAKKTILDQAETGMKNYSDLPYEEYFIKIYYYLLRGDNLASRDFWFEFQKKVLPNLTIKDVNDLLTDYLLDTNLLIEISIPQFDKIQVPEKRELLGLLKDVKTFNIKPYHNPITKKKLMEEIPSSGKIFNETHNSEVGTTELILSNGIRVILKPNQYSKNRIYFEGSYFDREEELSEIDLGCRIFFKNILREMGVGDFNKTELNLLFSEKNISIMLGISDSRNTISGNFPPGEIETALQLINLYFTRPRWDENAFSQSLKSIKDDILNRKNNSRFVFNDTLTSLQLNRKSIPYLDPLNFNNISFEKYKLLYENQFSEPGKFTFIFCGDFTMDNFKSALIKYIASIPPKLTDSGHNTQNSLIQNKVSLSKNTLPRDRLTSDFKSQIESDKAVVGASYMMRVSDSQIPYSSIIQDLLHDRLMTILRNEKAGVYSINIYNFLTVGADSIITFNIDFSTNPSRADEMAESLNNAILNLANSHISDIDFEKYKKNLSDKYAIKFKDNKWIVSDFLYSYYYKKKETLSEYENEIKSVSRVKTENLLKKLLLNSSKIQVIMRPY